jgi:hypothetical protein
MLDAEFADLLRKTEDDNFNFDTQPSLALRMVVCNHIAKIISKQAPLWLGTTLPKRVPLCNCTLFKKDCNCLKRIGN